MKCITCHNRSNIQGVRQGMVCKTRNSSWPLIPSNIIIRHVFFKHLNEPTTSSPDQIRYCWPATGSREQRMITWRTISVLSDACTCFCPVFKIYSWRYFFCIFVIPERWLPMSTATSSFSTR